MTRKRSVLARWDKDVYNSMKELMPDSTDAERSRKLFTYSLFGAERGLRDLDRSLSKKMNKRGSLLDLLYIIGVLFFFGMVVLFGAKLSGQFNSAAQNLTDLSASEKTTLSDLNSQYYSSVDGVMLFLAIGISLVTLILAALVRIHPIFIPLYIIGEVIVIIISAVASNAFQQAASDSNLASVASQLTFTGLILTYLPIFIGVIGTILMFIMYKTWSAEQ